MTQFTICVWRHRNKIDSRLLRQIFKMLRFYPKHAILKGLDDSRRKRLMRRFSGCWSSISPAARLAQAWVGIQFEGAPS
jgi:hypothetical protein